MISEGQRLLQSQEGYKSVPSPSKKNDCWSIHTNSFVCADSVAAPTWAPLLRLKIIWVFRNIARWFQTQHTQRRTVTFTNPSLIGLNIPGKTGRLLRQNIKFEASSLNFQCLASFVVGRMQWLKERKERIEIGANDL
jgi:hypothetical protein